jgi:hypothetical protein
VAKAKADGERMYQAGEKKMISDQSVFVDVLSNISFQQVVATIDAYPTVSKKKWSLEKAITKKTSGTVKHALICILQVAQDQTNFWTIRLNKSLNGKLIGTHDQSLIRTIVSRAEIDLPTIEALYASSFGTPLQEDIGADATKPYLKMLLSIIEGNGGGETDA